MLKKTLLFLILINFHLFFSKIQAQDSHFFTGGGIGFSIGTVTLFDIEPILGYKFENNIALGVGGIYKYYKYKDYYYLNNNYYDLESNIYGGKIFGRYYFNSESINLLNNIFAHTEIELLRFQYKDYNINYSQSAAIVESNKKYVDFTNILIGGGYKQDIGQNSAVYLMILWNLNDTPYNIYPNPLIKVGFDIGM